MRSPWGTASTRWCGATSSISTRAHTTRASHEALCGGVGDCASPQPGELGDFIGAQMAAANLEIPAVTVTLVGKGTVTGANNQINCGHACTTQVAAGTAVTLTALTPGNAVFGGWSGDCTGLDPSCSFTVNRATNVTATFTQVYTLSIGARRQRFGQRTRERRVRNLH